MTTCPNCGTNAGDEAVDCPDCGAALGQPTASFAPVGSVAESAAPQPTSAEGPVLVVVKGPQPGERFYLETSELTIGRDPESDIFLNDMTVSRAHAVLSVVSDAVEIRDLGSLNGVYVNGESVAEATLANGDSVQIGTFQMTFIAGNRR
jgi:pSer/pThr/pTyr-binding forkhead associated (FHA) protein